MLATLAQRPADAAVWYQLGGEPDIHCVGWPQGEIPASGMLTP